MDIFNKIYQEERQNDTTRKFQFVEENGRIRVANPEFSDTYNYPNKYLYSPPTGTPYLEKNPKAEKRAKKFFKFMTKNRTLYYEEDGFFARRQKARIDKFFNKMMAKGINFEYYDVNMLGQLLYKITDEEKIKQMYNRGFDVQKALGAGLYSNYTRDVWACVEDVNFPGMFDVPKQEFEYLINTRKNLNISQELFEKYFDENSRYYACADWVELLLKYGQISISPKQLEMIYNRIEGGHYSDIRFPVIINMYEYCVKSGKIKEDPESKYTTAKQLKGTKSVEKSEVQEQIDDIFEAAQNSVQ